MVHKRKNYLEWQEYFMSIAFLSAQRSKDPSTQVGACIVNKENKVVGIGYNGMPIGCSDDSMPWNKAADTSQEKWLRSKLPYVCHAELNAVMNKNSADVRGCIMYVALFPCNMCAQIIIQSGISEVIYYTVKYPHKSHTKAAKHLLDMAGITYRQFIPKQPKVEIIFRLIEETAGSVPTLTTHQQLCSGSGHEVSDNGSNKLSTSDLDWVKDCNKENCIVSPSQVLKRSTYLEWEEYFMAMAFLSAQRSKDPRTQVGACIVNKEKKIVGIGYNGMPRGCSDDIMPWNRAADDKEASWLDSKSPYVCHAELNAVLNKNTADIKGCTIYVALFPCNMCAQVVIQSGIEEVVYYSDKYHDKPEFWASRHMLTTAGVTYRQFRPKQEKIVIDFSVHGAAEQLAGAVEEDSKAISVNDSKDVVDDQLKMVANNNNNNNSNMSSTTVSNGVKKELGSLRDKDDQLPHKLAGHDGRMLARERSSQVQHVWFAFLSFVVAGALVLFSWHSGQLNKGQLDYL